MRLLLLSLQLPDDLAHIPMLRRVSREALASCRVAPQDVDDLELLVGELAANAARHARAARYRLDLELYQNKEGYAGHGAYGGYAVVTVTDTGGGFERANVPPPGTPRPDTEGGGGNGDGWERPGGWGLPLVETLAESVEYLPANPRGTVVRARRRVALAAAPAARV